MPRKIAEPKQERPEFLPNGQRWHDHVMANLLTVPASDNNFKSALNDATIEEVAEALGRLGEAANKVKRQTLEARYRRLQKEQKKATPDAKDSPPAKPVIPGVDPDGPFVARCAPRDPAERKRDGWTDINRFVSLDAALRHVEVIRAQRAPQSFLYRVDPVARLEGQKA